MSRRPPARIELCGPLVAEIGGRRVEADLPGRQGRLLFTYLVAHRDRPVRRDELIDVLWPESPPAAPEAALSTLLARLRRAGGADLLVGRAHLTITLGPDAWVDVEAATRHAAAAEAALHGGDPASALAESRSALELLSRPFLPELESPWVDERRRELDDLVAPLLEIAARAGLELGSPELEAVERTARALVEREPYRESGYALLMETQARRGNVAEALRVFDRLRVLLREELGVGPSASVTALTERLLRESDAEVLGAPPVLEEAGATGGTSATDQIPLPALDPSGAGRPFVGREADLDRLRRCLAGAGSGAPALILLAGEAGVGKTRLAAHFAREAHTGGATVLYGRSDEDTVVPYQPFAQALRHYFVHAPSLALEPALQGEVRELGRLVPMLAGQALDAREPLPGEPETERYRLFEAVASLLGHLARRGALVLVLDDLHWADKPSLLLLRHVCRSVDVPGLMMVATYRDVEVDVRHPLADLLADLRRDRAFERVSLRGLDAQETAALVSARGDQPATDGFVRRLQEETEGNPYFIEEVLRSLAEQRGVDEEGEPPEAAFERMGVPEGVKEVILRRLARLSDRANDAVTAASVIGREFHLGVLEALVDAPASELITTLEELMEAGLIVELPHELDRFAFCHALVREALYERLSTSRRVRLHLRVAETLEGQAALGDPHPAELAHHFFEARRVAGPDKAIHYAIEAAERASSSLAYEEAVAHYKRALQALESLGREREEERCEVMIRLGRAQWRSGDAGARQVFQDAGALARGRSPEQLARAALGFGGRSYEVGRVDEPLIALLEEALAALGEGDSALRVKLTARLADALHFAGAGDRIAALSVEAVEMARRVGDTDALVAALTGRHAALLHVEHLEERLRVSDELLALAERVGHHELTALGYHWRLYDLCEAGDLERAERLFASLNDLTIRLRQPLYRHFALSWEAKWAEAAGRFDDAERLARESYVLARRAQASYANSNLAGHMFGVARDRGELAGLMRAVKPLIGDSPALVLWQAGLVLASLEAGREERARTEFDRLASDDFAAVPSDLFWLAALCLLAEACAALGDPRARGLYRLLHPYADRCAQIGLSSVLGPVERFLGLLAASAGDPRAAARHFEAALSSTVTPWAPVAVAHTQCDYAAMLLDGDDSVGRGRARELLAASGRSAEVLGMKGLGRRVLALEGRANAAAGVSVE